MKSVRVDLPEFVHEQLKAVPGGKKANAERILIDWAKRQQKKQ